MQNPCRNCPICDLAPEPTDLIASLPANHYNRQALDRQAYDLTYCACGELVYLSPLPSAEDIETMYAKSHQFDALDSVESPYRGPRAAMVLEYTTSRLLEILRATDIPTSTQLRVLEVGAGLSWMCRAAKIVNGQNQTVAQDLTSEAVAECQWVNHYVVEDLLTSRAIDQHGPYDIISLTHVIEHLAEPVAMLERLQGLLSDRGMIFVTAPYRPIGWQRGADVGEWESWSYNHIPAHIQYFSKGSFEKAARASGLEVALWDHHQDDGQAFEGWLRKGFQSPR